MSTTIPTPAEDAARTAAEAAAESERRLAEARALRTDATLAALRDFAAALLPVMERAHQTAGEALASLRATVEREQARLDAETADRRNAEKGTTNA